MLYQPAQEEQEGKRTPASECAQGDRALQLLRALGSAPPAAWLSPQDVFLQWQVDPDPRGREARLCSLHGMLLSHTASHQPWPLQPGGGRCALFSHAGLFCIPKRRSAVRTGVSGQGSRTGGTDSQQPHS